MEFLKKYYVFVILSIVCLFCAFLFWQNSKLTKEITQLSNLITLQNSKFEAFQANSVSESKFNKLSQELISNFSSLKTSVENLNQKVIAVGKLISTIPAQNIDNSSSDSETITNNNHQKEKCISCDLFDYTNKIQHKNIFLGEMPFSLVSFDASKKDPWTIETDSISFKVSTVLTKAKDNNFTFLHQISTTNNSRIDLKNKEFLLNITESTYVQLDEKTKKWRSKIHLDLGIDNLISYPKFDYLLGVNLGVAFFNYGKTEDDNIWRLLHLGFGIYKNENLGVYATIAPVQYNLGTLLPLISDFWVFPNFGTNFSQLFFGIGMGTTL